MIDITMMRWRIERDYQELKQEVGLDHFEGRSWRGFHHHATMCIAAYGFLVAERAAFSPLATSLPTCPRKPALPESYRTQRLHRSGLSATSRTPSQRSDDASMSASSRYPCCARPIERILDAAPSDAVRLPHWAAIGVPRCSAHFDLYTA